MSATETKPLPAATKTTSKAATKRSTAKPTAKPTAKLASKPAAKLASTAAPAHKASAPKEEKAKKIKMVRDSFTMPKQEFSVLETLKARAVQLNATVKKTELIRAGIKALAAMPDAAFLAAVRAVPNLKTGRPAKSE